MKLSLILAAFASTEVSQAALKQPWEPVVSPDDQGETNVVQDSAAPFRISLYKTFDQLSATELNALRAMYQGLDPKDEPPFPLQGYKPIVDELLKIQQASGVLGRVFATVLVDENGVGQSVSFYEIPDQQLSKVITFVLIKKTQYKPARCSGQPCKMNFPFLFDFNPR